MIQCCPNCGHELTQIVVPGWDTWFAPCGHCLDELASQTEAEMYGYSHRVGVA